MVFGIGEGKIDMKLNKLSFSPGEKITGTLNIHLNSPKKAKRLVVEIIATQRVRARKSYRTTTVYHFEKELDGEKEYSDGDYQFELLVPGNSQPMTMQGEFEGNSQAADAMKMAGTAMKGMGSLGLLGMPSPILWRVHAKLDIPLGIDISKDVQIQVA